MTPEYHEIIEQSMIAREQYLQRNFQKARELYGELFRQGDSVSGAYMSHCDFYLENPPAENWTGVWRMMEK